MSVHPMFHVLAGASAGVVILASAVPARAQSSTSTSTTTSSGAGTSRSSSSGELVETRGPRSAGPRSELPNTSWREGAAERRAAQLDPDFYFELRFGPYWPQIDEEFASPGPYERVFDNDAQFYFGLEADWLPIRIPYVGKLGAGFGWGITPASGNAIDPSTGEETDVENSITIMPMHASLVLRGTELMRRTDVPLVPYGKFGFGFATWSTSTSSGTSEVCGAGGGEDGCSEGEDTTLGLHGALGLAVALDWVSPQRSKNLNHMGIGHLYLFGEWMNAMLDGLGSRPQLHVGTSTFVGGLALDF